MSNYASKESSKPSAVKNEPLIGQVVESILVDRFSEVHHRIAELLKAGSNKAEAVHQLRVASRRAEASLDFFRIVVDKSFRRHAANQLKELRSGLGDLRDLDVLAERIGRGNSKVAECLIGMIRQDYDGVMQNMESRVRSFVSNLPLNCARHEATIRPSARKLANKPFKAWAFRRADKIAQRFLTSLKQTDRTAKSMHRLRIRGKKLRYSLEVLEPIVPDIVDSQAYRRLARLQTILGKVQDGIVQREILERLTQESDQSGVRRFVEEEALRRKRIRTKLLRQLEPLRLKRHRYALAEELESLLSLARS